MSDRDSWATPLHITELLPMVDLDPCSNAQSTVRSANRYDLACGQDGLALPWVGSAFINPPFSDIAPWAKKLIAEERVTAAAFLVNVDPSCSWWRLLTMRLDCALMFRKRIQFVPPPGIKASTNSKAQVLLMDEPFLARCQPALLALGKLWQTRRAEQFASF